MSRNNRPPGSLEVILRRTKTPVGLLHLELQKEFPGINWSQTLIKMMHDIRAGRFKPVYHGSARMTEENERLKERIAHLESKIQKGPQP